MATFTESRIELNDGELTAAWVTQPLPGGTPVGVRQWQVDDPERQDPSTGMRRFMVTAWYPGLADEGAPRARITDILYPHMLEGLEILSGPASGEEKADFLRRASELTLRAQRGLAVKPGEKRPVLIYYPGGQGHRMTNAGLCEQLAAAGYVVFALDAPRDAPIVVFPDGKVVTQPMGDDEDYISPRVADVFRLLDLLPEWNGTAFGGSLDLQQIGMFGASRGGYLSTIASMQDHRIKAAINMDGFTWGLWVQDGGTGLNHFPAEFQAAARASKRPLLRLMGDQGGPEGTKALFEKEMPDTGGDFFVASVHGWEHADFGQTPFLSGEIKNLYAKPMTLVTAENAEFLLGVVRDYFDWYLRGTGKKPEVGLAPRGGMDVCSRMN